MVMGQVCPGLTDPRVTVVPVSFHPEVDVSGSGFLLP